MSHPPFGTRDAISRFLILRDTPQAVDLCFVFGSPSISNILPAIDLYHAGLTRRIVISGATVTRDNVPEWQFYRDRAVADGVDPDAILIEPKALNTLENAVLGAELISQAIGWEGIATMALCAKPIHTRRALMTARQVFPDHIRFITLSGDDPRDLNEHNWWLKPHGRQRVLEELGRVSTYAIKGDIGDV